MQPLLRLIPRLRFLTLALGILLFLSGDLLNADWRWYGSIVWALLSGYFMYHIGLWLASRFVLPIEQTWASRRLAYWTLERFASKKKTLIAIVRDGKILLRNDGTERKSERGKGAILIDSTSAVSLSTDSSHRRIIGPGLHFTRDGEKIDAVIDLRPQKRSRKIDAQTRDGLWLQTEVSVSFQIDGVKLRKLFDIDRSKEVWPEPFTWSQLKVRRALSMGSAGSKEISSWDMFPLNKAIQQTRLLVAQFTFDRLTEPQNPTLNRRQEITEKVEAHIRQQSGRWGIKDVSVRIGEFIPLHLEIDMQRFQIWLADWQSREEIVKANGEARARRIIDGARSQAEMDTISRVIQALKVSRQAGVNNADVIALRFLETLQRLASDPQIKQMLDHNLQNSLKQLQHRIDGKETDENSEYSA